jgi:hypothetical protein
MRQFLNVGPRTGILVEGGNIRIRALPLLAAGCLACLAAPASAEGVLEFLRSRGFTDAELRKLGRGEAIVKSLGGEVVGANGTAEVAVIGAVRVDVPREVFLDALRNVQAFRSDGISQLGMIGPTPNASDFAAFSVSADDLRELRSCKPGDCLVKLPGVAIERLRTEVDWRAPDHPEQVNRLARESLLAAMGGYMREGTDAFLALEDKPTAVSLDQNLRALFQSSPGLLADCPEMKAFMLEFPKCPLEGAESVFYWSVNEFGLKRTVMLTHAATYSPKGSGDAVVLWKQLWASHYFNGGLSVTAYRSEADASYVVQLDRLRADGMGGIFGVVKRGRMAGGMAKSLTRFLVATRTNLRARVPGLVGPVSDGRGGGGS